MIAALLAAAWAHGPAPAVLEVLDWEPGVCAPVAPSLVRTNIGLMLAAPTGGYSYGCPSRWGGAEQALAATDGSRVLLAGSGGVFVSDDGGCSARRIVMDAHETPVAARGRDALWLVTRSFDAGDASVWRVDAEAVRIDRSSDRFFDGLVLDDAGGWLAGAVPSPSLARLEGGEVAPLSPAWPTLDARLDRLTPRAAATGGVWLLAGAGAARTIWWTDGAAVEVGPGPAESVHGPARLGERWLAVLDGALWVRDEAGWRDAGVAVDWTCLQDTPQGPLACQLDVASLVTSLGDDGPTLAAVVSIDQLGPPEAACDGVDGGCDLDWLHFGGESGYVDSAPAPCPGDLREPLVDDASDTPPEAACGCGHGDPGVAGVALALALRRRSRRAALSAG